MKLLVFAHVPPPHHGQSYMVELMLEGFGKATSSTPTALGDTGIQCFHVDARFSSSLEDIGGIRPGKIFRLFELCAAAIRLGLEHGIDSLYFVPAPAKRSAVVRDWLVLGILRLFFRNIILHWHAYGLGHWAGSMIEHPAGPTADSMPPPRLFGRLDPLARALTRFIYRHCPLSISLTKYNARDAEVFSPRTSVVVPNGIPDQCGSSFPNVLAARQERLRTRRDLTEGRSLVVPASTFDLLYLAHCTREKGLFTAMEAVSLANARLQTRGCGYRIRLHIAGSFPSKQDQKEYTRLLEESPEARQTFLYYGHVGGSEKATLLADADALIFPTFFQPETFGLVLLEALSFGLPIIATRWRGIPEIVPPHFAHLAAPGDSATLVQAILTSTDFEDFQSLRNLYLENYTLDKFWRRLASAIQAAGHERRALKSEDRPYRAPDR